MSQKDLKYKTSRGITWSLVEKFATQGVQFVFGIIIARLLCPEDYGIIAMPLIFLAIAQCFIDSGFSTALIRKNELKEEDLSTAFIFSIIVGVVCYSVLFLSSPFIADFYNTPILTDLLKITALATLFNPLCTVQQAILTRELNFKKQALITVAGALASGIIGLIMANYGYGVWALVVQQVAGYTMRTILFWFTVKWKPSLVWSKESFKYLWGFGNKVLVQGLIANIFDNMYPLVIGKVYSADDLGNYTRAHQFTNLPSVNITGVLFRVALPVMSTIQNDKERLKVVFEKMIRVSAFCMFPVMLGLSALANPLIQTVLTAKWYGCVALIQLLCFSLMWYPIHALNLTILTALGRSDFTLKLEIIKKAISIIALIITVPFGIIWMVASNIVVNCLCLIVNTYYTKKIIEIGLIQQIHFLGPIFLTSFAMWTSILIINSMIADYLLQLIVGAITGFVVYGMLSILFHRTEIKALLEIFKGSRKE